jgi:uroporphyrinogen decarboxylase
MPPRPIDNMRTLLDGGSPEWIPFSLDVGACPGFTEPIDKTFRQATGSDDAAEYFQADVRLFSLPTRFGGDDPAALHASLPPGTTFDEWGIGHLAAGSEGTVEKTYPPLAGARSPADVEALPSPIIETEVDTSAVERHHAAGYPVFGYAGSIYEWAWWIRGMQQFMIDLAAEPAMAEAILAKITAHTTRLAVASALAGIDVLCFYDDAGMQTGMQISPRLWRRFIKPAWQHVLEAVRQAAPHARFFLHSCGKIDAIVPDIIELGFHALHPVQPECMDFEATHREYGRDIVPAAAISAQRIFPFGTPEEVRREVRRLAAIATDRRAILMPSNRIQPETPWANVVAFAEEARACGQGNSPPPSP